MLIPRETIVYRNLKSSFTDFDELLRNLDSISLTGYIYLEFENFNSVIFFQNGRICNAVANSDSTTRIGQEAINHVNAKANEPGGEINVFTLSSELVLLFSNAVKSEHLYKDLASEFTSLDKLIQKLEDEEHTGHIEAVCRNNKKNAFLFFQSGELLKCILWEANKALVEVDDAEEILSNFTEEEAVFNVYKSPVSLLGSNNWLATKYELNELLVLWGAILKLIEEQVGKERFAPALKQTLFKLADTYLFLDPFLGEFKYGDGKITLKSKSIENFNDASRDIVQAMIDQLKIKQQINSVMVRIREEFAETIEKYALTNTIYELTA